MYVFVVINEFRGSAGRGLFLTALQKPIMGQSRTGGPHCGRARLQGHSRIKRVRTVTPLCFVPCSVAVVRVRTCSNCCLINSNNSMGPEGPTPQRALLLWGPLFVVALWAQNQ